MAHDPHATKEEKLAEKRRRGVQKAKDLIERIEETESKIDAADRGIENSLNAQEREAQKKYDAKLIQFERQEKDNDHLKSSPPNISVDQRESGNAINNIMFFGGQCTSPRFGHNRILDEGPYQSPVKSLPWRSRSGMRVRPPHTHHLCRGAPRAPPPSMANQSKLIIRHRRPHLCC